MPPSNELRWANVEQLRGWRILETNEDLQATQVDAERIRHTDNPVYQAYRRAWAEGHPENLGLSKEQSQGYLRLNHELHEKIMKVVREHFKDTPLPAEYAATNTDPERWRSIGTPFTYQNYDCYAPTYECYVAVLKNYISADLLKSLQNILTDEHRDWCVVVSSCEDISFGDGGDEQAVVIYSDQVLVKKDVAAALGVP